MNEPRQASPPRRRSPVVAVMLQCVPLLATAGCLVNGATSQGEQGIAFILWWSSLFWGLGYLYVGRKATSRGILALLVGPLLAFGSCSAIFMGARVDFEHFRRTPTTVADADRASVETALVIGAAVLLLAVDAWRLARSEEGEEAPGAPPASPLTAGEASLRKRHA